MTAQVFKQYCEQAGLQCVSQEIINRATKYPLPHDCLSLFTLKNSVWARPNRVFKNMLFSYESLYLSKLARLYSASSFEEQAGIYDPASPGYQERQLAWKLKSLN